MSRIIPALSAAERTAFIAAARSFLDTPFKHRGRTEGGVDCLGLVVLSMRAIGHEMADKKVYGRDPVNDGIAAAARAHFGEPVWTRGQSLDCLRAGDVLLMQWHQQPNHVAIVTDYPFGGLAVIHSLKQNERVVEHRLSSPWPRRILEGFSP
jgi:cell wall-associated NlpC family hydrolase